jgi:hypothetical protein
MDPFAGIVLGWIKAAWACVWAWLCRRLVWALCAVVVALVAVWAMVGRR